MIYDIKLVNKEFSEYIHRSLENLRIKKDIYVEGYLVSLLSKFIREEFKTDPLIQKLHDSETLEDYIRLGDETLFITGFFPENFQKKKNKKYAMNIGKKSYNTAAIILNFEGEGYIFNVLSKRFETYSDVLNEVKYSMLEQVDDKTFFELYKIWRNYKSHRILKKLKDTKNL